MKKLLTLLLFTAFFFRFGTPLYAQTPTPNSATPATTVVEDVNTFTTDPPQFPTNEQPENYISDLTPSVKVAFPGLDLSTGDYKVCLRNDYCIGNPIIASLPQEKLTQLLTANGIKDEDMVKKRLNDVGDVFEGDTITVCGKGKSDLYKKGDCNPKNEHYFHAGSFHIITIYDKADNYVAIARAGFYVNHGAPEVTITPNTGLVPGTKFEVAIKQSVIKPDGKNRNNYQVVLEGPGYKKEECDWLDKSINPRTFQFPLPQQDTMHYSGADSKDLVQKGFTVPGKYIFKINEQNSENDIRSDDCQGGFTYMHITCTIGTDPKKNLCEKPLLDPRGVDGKKLFNLLNLINGSGENPVPLPCNKEMPYVTNPLDCKSIDTAIGPIQLTPVGFITRLFSIVLAIAGLGALLLIIFSGYRLMISRGNPEIIKGARETLTSAIVGLFFIIFSLVILSVIAGDILKIPGFS
ncbi:MAG: pilin [Candidatus Levybacteria bacterium]|nr:pilin [Candidatus Levybacteria bacterium]